MYIISKEFQFSASHQLGINPIHGHNYKVIIEFCSDRIMNIDMQPLSDYVASKLDHKHLVDYFDNIPKETSIKNCFVLGYLTIPENIAKHLFNFCYNLGWDISKVGVSETSGNWAWYQDSPQSVKLGNSGGSITCNKGCQK